MSRIWKLPVSIPDWVQVSIQKNVVSVTWKLGTLKFTYTTSVNVENKDNQIIVSPLGEDKRTKALRWTTRACINNMVIWVTKWFKKTLEINWVWYKFEIKWTIVVLSVGFSHKVELEIPMWIEVKLDEKKKNQLHISWFDKELVGKFSAKIRSIKRPEPYKGKWIKYLDEHIIRKAWKSGKK